MKTATTTRTWDTGETETYYWLEWRPDEWIGVTRPPKSRDEAEQFVSDLENECNKQRRFPITAATRYLRQTSDTCAFQTI